MALIEQKLPVRPGVSQRRLEQASRLLASYGISILGLACCLLFYQMLSLYGGFSPKLVPGLGTVVETLARLIENGTLVASTVATLYRLIAGFALAGVVGVSLGLLMGHYEWAEDTLLPIMSFCYPIPGLAYAPLFVMWFGLGDLPTVLLVGAAASFVVVINTWKGVKSVKPIWLRSARVMGANDHALFLRVIVPGALPYILVGLRLGLANAWRILIGVEMVTSVRRGLGWMIFGAQSFLNIDVMLATIVVIGAIGLLLEKQVFQRVENYTVARWGMVAG